MKIEIYRRRRLLTRAQWYWRTRDSRNGKILGRSAEGYNNRGDCIASVAKHQREMALADPREVAE